MIFKRITVVVLLVLLSSCIVRSSTPFNRAYIGRWLTIRPNRDMLELAKFSTREFQHDSVLKVTSARVQHILDTCYIVNFQMNSGLHWQAELYRAPQGKLTLLELLER